jgi:hypothetical protein
LRLHTFSQIHRSLLRIVVYRCNGTLTKSTTIELSYQLRLQVPIHRKDEFPKTGGRRRWTEEKQWKNMAMTAAHNTFVLTVISILKQTTNLQSFAFSSNRFGPVQAVYLRKH